MTRCPLSMAKRSDSPGASVTPEALSADPYPFYTRMREEEPVSWVPALNMYFVTRYEDVRTIMQDDIHYVVGTENSLIYDVLGKHMMTVEGELHNRYKGAHQRFFLPPAVRASLDDRMRDHANTLIDGFAADGETEMRAAFASRLPVLTMLTLFGLDAGEEPQLRGWYDDLEAALSNFTWDEETRQRGHRSVAAFEELLQSYLDRMRGDPEARVPGSLLTELLDSPENERLNDEEIRRNALIIFFGGISTVEALILNALYALSLQPGTLDRVAADHELIPAAITETVRWLGPVQSATRHVAVDTTLHSHEFKQGDTVNCMLAAANRDESVFENPDEFDIDRRNANRHVGFATGPHHCLGSHLARSEARIALECLFGRLPDFRLDLERVIGPKGYEFRQPTSAIATWTS